VKLPKDLPLECDVITIYKKTQAHLQIKINQSFTRLNIFLQTKNFLQ